jgi:hypothetical protein
MTWDEFKECVRIQGNLDLEVVDVAFVQPLKDLQAWWDRQSSKTKAYVTFLFGSGLAAEAVKTFLKRILGPAAAAAAAEALGAVLVGLALGFVMDILGRCGLQAVDA